MPRRAPSTRVMGRRAGTVRCILSPNDDSSSPGQVMRWPHRTPGCFCSAVNADLQNCQLAVPWIRVSPESEAPRCDLQRCSAGRCRARNVAPARRTGASLVKSDAIKMVAASAYLLSARVHFCFNRVVVPGAPAPGTKKPTGLCKGGGL